MPKVSGATGRGRAARASKKTSSARRAGKPKKPLAKSIKSTTKAVKKIDKARIRPIKSDTSKKPDRRGTPKAKGTVKTKRGGPIGNPPFEATPEQRIRVETYVTAGTKRWLIAEYMGMSQDTLERHFKVELEHGKDRVIAKVGSSMVQKALDGDENASKYVLGRIGGWSEKHRVAVGGDDDAPPIKHETSPQWDLSGLSRAELKEMKRLRQKAMARAGGG